MHKYDFMESFWAIFEPNWLGFVLLALANLYLLYVILPFHIRTYRKLSQEHKADLLLELHLNPQGTFQITLNVAIVMLVFGAIWLGFTRYNCDECGIIAHIYTTLWILLDILCAIVAICAKNIPKLWLYNDGICVIYDRFGNLWERRFLRFGEIRYEICKNGPWYQPQEPYQNSTLEICDNYEKIFNPLYYKWLMKWRKSMESRFEVRIYFMINGKERKLRILANDNAFAMREIDYIIAMFEKYGVRKHR